MRCFWALAWPILSGLMLVGCIDETNVDVMVADASVAESPEAGVEPDTRVCEDLDSKQPMPARSAAIEGAPVSSEKTVYVDDLFNQLVTHCGGCHVDVGLGGFQTSRASFSETVNQGWVDSMYLNDPNTVMPTPSVGGTIYKKRAPDDPVNAFAELLQKWVDQGRPRDLFKVPVDSAAAHGPFRLKPDVAKSLTNIGNCLPEKALYASDPETMTRLDAKFATMAASPTGTLAERIGLPERLSDTDLTTFDSRELAKTGVLSYAPNYPQWVDPDSRSIRHIRVPRGASIAFDASTQQFTIPAGTRFYRTLAQRVKERDGSEKWRKFETQLIVAWPNYTSKSGESLVTSLFGTYAWNDDESEALLVTDPYRNGEPFRDRTVTYVADEAQAEKTLSKAPANVSYALHADRAIRSFAIMGSRRCGHCHRGSQTRNFVLGFTPLQIARRAKGEGGITDDVGVDELSQLSRFIEHGLITGLASQEEVVPLEESEGDVVRGDRPPRNEYELRAQAYVLGNCAHCHNPHGDANVWTPELQGNVLDFMPSATGGGIFQYPLERYSARIMRAAGGPSPTVPMPYITPSIMELGPPRATLSAQTYWKAKCTVEYPGGISKAFPLMAPWRSLIYRTVATPFSYSDDLALMLRMPQDTQGFDCNAPRIIGDWMVSITSELKPEVASEYGLRTFVAGTYQFPGPNEQNLSISDPLNRCWSSDATPQPYYEVKRGKTAVAATTDRMYKFHNSPVNQSSMVTPTVENPYPEIPSYYSACPDNFDIFDPKVLDQPDKFPVPTDTDVTGAGKVIMPAEGVPNHTHWVTFDPTVVPGDWAPRRPDWHDVLVKDGKPPPATDQTKWNFEALALEVIVGDRVGGTSDGVHLTGTINSLAATEMSMGVWKAKAGCNFTRTRTVAQYQAAQRAPTWMQAGLDSGSLTGSEPVYSVTPGEMIHNLVCANCHGERGDSSGRHATVLSEMTGGRATVTDLRNGMMKYENSQRVFASAPGDFSTSTEDWAARYFNWMALGGTKQAIPRSILAMVATVPVLGQPRPADTPPLDANMLSSARNRCASLIPVTLTYHESGGGTPIIKLQSRDKHGRYSFEGGALERSGGLPNTTLIYANGDASLWARVCAVDNPPLVKAFTFNTAITELEFNAVSDLYPPELFPANRSMVNHLGKVVSSGAGGVPSDNYFPWCVRVPANDADKVKADAWLASHAADDGTLLPYCPEQDDFGKPYIGRKSVLVSNDAHLSRDAMLRWTMRGASNAGLLTYVYLGQLARDEVDPTPPYDQCEKISY